MRSNNKILIVDDDSANLTILHSILKNDHIISVAKSGEKALEIIPKFRPDLILLDVVMPGMDGYEICRKIRSDEKFHFIKIILVSGRGQIEERLEGYKSGADDYITKPFNREELEAKVRIFLRLKRTEEVDQIKNDILTLFSHETRTPLNAIIGPTHLILKDENATKDIIKFAKMIQEGSKWLMTIVNKTTILCNLKRNKELVKSPNSVNMMLKVVLNKLNAAITKKNLSLNIHCENDIGMMADWKLMILVFEYVIDNAIKYSPANKNIDIKIVSEKDCNKIYITDQGTGIEDDYLDKIFEEFSIRDIMSHQKGFRISLAIAKIIMDQHGASIKVESEINKGTTVILNYPNEDE